MGDTNRRSHRRMMRRRRKSEQLLKVLLAFCAEHGLDPAFVADLIHEQFLSDEVSGPEDNSGESKEAWKYSDLIHDLERFRLDGDSISPAAELNLKYDRVGAGRCSDRIPRYAPYDFGMSVEWLKANRDVPANKRLLKDWGKWPEPAECGLTFERDDDGEIVTLLARNNLSTISFRFVVM
ncbi:hypothetical protein B0H10DRAFT_2214747 [Mycena sp. CBHHK59/15]|nr:hypothetical protein B0H10DRAFT_2214747 [Mycena sp. CBHHK59/15]